MASRSIFLNFFLLCLQRTTHQCFKTARYQFEHQNLDNVSTKRARFQSVSCQYMKLAGRNPPVRKSKSADYIPIGHYRPDYRMIKKIPTVSISIASDSDNGLNEDSS